MLMVVLDRIIGDEVLGCGGNIHIVWADVGLNKWVAQLSAYNLFAARYILASIERSIAPEIVVPACSVHNIASFNFTG